MLQKRMSKSDIESRIAKIRAELGDGVADAILDSASFTADRTGVSIDKIFSNRARHFEPYDWANEREIENLWPFEA